LLLNGQNDSEWRKVIVRDNVLQIRSPKAAIRIANLLRARLVLMNPALWQMVRNGSSELATQACFAAAIKHSPLVGDYLDLVIREKYQIFAPNLSPTDWSNYIDECRARDPEMGIWSDRTIARLRVSVHSMLAQVGYIDNVRTLQLQSVHIARELLTLLREQQEHYVHQCITVRP